MENKAGMYHVKSGEHVDIFVSFIGSCPLLPFQGRKAYFPLAHFGLSDIGEGCFKFKCLF